MPRDPEVRFIISNEPRRLPLAVWNQLFGPKPDPSWPRSNGCTLSPDKFDGVPIWAACFIHDYHYLEHPLGGNWASRRYSDYLFRRNIFRLYVMYGKSKARARWISRRYWWGVRLGGTEFFNYGEDQKPSGWINRIRERFGAFLTKEPEFITRRLP